MKAEAKRKEIAEAGRDLLVYLNSTNEYDKENLLKSSVIGGKAIHLAEMTLAGAFVVHLCCVCFQFGLLLDFIVCIGVLQVRWLAMPRSKCPLLCASPPLHTTSKAHNRMFPSFGCYCWFLRRLS